MSLKYEPASEPLHTARYNGMSSSDVSTERASQIGLFIFVVLIKKCSVQRHVIIRYFDRIAPRMVGYLAIYDSGQVFLEHLLLSRHTSQSLSRSKSPSEPTAWMSTFY